MKRSIFISTFFLFISTYSTNGQTAHYWTEHYGTRSMLLSGVVIGSVDDLGAVFYNPARIWATKNEAFLVSADIFELKRLVIKKTPWEKILI